MRLALVGLLALLPGCSKKTAPASEAPPSPLSELAPRLVALRGPCGLRPDGAGLAVALTRSGLRAGSELAPLVPAPASKAEGFDAAYKKDPPGGLLLPALASAAASAPAPAAAPDKAPGRRAWVFVESGASSYRMLIEALYTLGQSEVSEMALVGRAPDGACALPLFLPRMGGRPGARPTLRVSLRADGISLRAAWERFAPAAALSEAESKALAGLADALNSAQPKAGAAKAAPYGVQGPRPAASASARAGGEAAWLSQGGLVAGPGCAPGAEGKTFEGAPGQVPMEELGACAGKLRGLLLQAKPSGSTDEAAQATVEAESGVEADAVLRVVEALRAAPASASDVSLAVAR